jgi:hypothetical protein
MREHSEDRTPQRAESDEQILDSRDQIADSRYQTTDSRDQTEDKRQAADSRQQTEDGRQQAPDSRQQTRTIAWLGDEPSAFLLDANIRDSSHQRQQTTDNRR